MRRVLHKILQILDGTPAVYGNYSRGQSVVELALVTPLLIILLMGLAEIGWFANNYLIILETTRVGARYGTIQTGDTSPLKWPNEGSLIPALSADQTVSLSYRNCATLESQPSYRRFYNLIVCRMLESMSPLEFRGFDDPISGETRNGVDDIIVSAFALQTVDPSSSSQIPSFMRSQLSLAAGYPANQQQVLVIGRYPTNANECTFDTTEKNRDPFNYINYTGSGYTASGWRNYLLPSGLADTEENRLYYELIGSDTGDERQRGYSFTGQHVIGFTRSLPAGQQCYGSEWTMDEVEQLMNLSNFSMTNQSQRSALPSQGIVLVEMYWRHSLLLRNPVFNPVFTIINDPSLDPSNPNDAGSVISVWAAFPLPSVEPRIKYAPGS